MLWSKAKSTRKVEDGRILTFEGPYRLRISVMNCHAHYEPGEWMMECRPLDIERQLAATSAEEAITEAVGFVRSILAEMLESLN